MSDSYVGEIRIFAGNFAPVNWALCAGQTLAITDYSTLFSLIGTTYGGDGRSTFQLPDYRGRVVMGQGRGPGLTARLLGQRLGVTDVTLAETNMPVHSHPLRASTSAATSTANPAGQTLATGTGNFYSTAPTANTPYPVDAVQAFGGNQPHTNMMPYMPLNYIISLRGIFPPRPS